MKRAFAGLGAWLVQRVTAVFMLLYIVFLLTYFLLDRPTSYLAWRAWIERPMIGISSFAFCAALLAHMWVGLRDVILDYVKPVAVRLGALALLGLGLIGLGAWVIRILALGRFQ